MVGPRICEDKKAWLTERCLELVSECTRSVPSSNGMTTSVLSKFQDSPLTIGSCRLDNDILRVLYSDNYTSSKLKLLPGLAKVEDVNSYGGQKDNSITETETNTYDECCQERKMHSRWFNPYLCLPLFSQGI